MYIEIAEDEMIAFYLDGNSLKATGKRFGCDGGTVRARLRKRGIAVRRGRAMLKQVVSPATGLRPCSGCKRDLPVATFARCSSRPDGYQAWCKSCMADALFRAGLMRRFGITPETYYNLLKEQNGGCAVCGKVVEALRLGKPYRLAVDHCHLTGTIRGILCSACNRGIGLFKDNPELLEHAAKYLRSQGGLPCPSKI